MMGEGQGVTGSAAETLAKPATVLEELWPCLRVKRIDRLNKKPPLGLLTGGSDADRMTESLMGTCSMPNMDLGRAIREAQAKRQATPANERPAVDRWEREVEIPAAERLPQRVDAEVAALSALESSRYIG